MAFFFPSFLRVPVYAFELSDKSYKYLRLKETRAGLVVDDFGEGEIAAGVIERGEIKKKDVLVALLRNLFRKKNIRFAAVSLPEEKGFLENVKLSGVKEDEIRQALALQLEEYIPLPPAEVIFDFTLAGKEKDHLDVVLSAFPQTLVENYLEVFSSAGAAPAVMESELVAAARALVPKNFPAAAMIIDWGKTRISFSIVKNSVLHFASTVPIGGEALDEAISKNLNVSREEAQKLKAKNGFLQNKSSLQVFQAIVPLVTAVREETEKYISYWETHSEGKEKISQLWLAGGDGNLPGFAEYLESELKIPAALGNPWCNIKFPDHYLPNLERSQAVRFATSVGLALAAKKAEEKL